jgi:hypothetical protein
MSRRIPDPGSLIAGITFAGVGLIFLVGRVDLADRARWVWPIVLVGLGAGLLAAVLRRGATPAAAGPAAASSTGQPTATSTLAPSGEAGLPSEPEVDHALDRRDQAEAPARDTAADDAAGVERGAVAPGLSQATSAEEPSPAEGSAQTGRAEDPAGGDLPRRQEP